MWSATSPSASHRERLCQGGSERGGVEAWRCGGERGWIAEFHRRLAHGNRPVIEQQSDGDEAIGTVAGADGELDLGYQVRIDAFSGPMDLLLYLVRRAQVDVADIPIAAIADQFVAAVTVWEDMDLDVAGDFVLMAATLLEIKSRLVSPPPEGETADGEDDADRDVFDPRADLIRQLLAYRRFKDASHLLDELEWAQTERGGRQLREAIPEDPGEVDGLSLENCDPYALFSEWEGILAKLHGLGPRTVVYDDVPMEHRMAALAATLQASGETCLSRLFQATPARVGRVGILVALLECVRQRIVEAVQHEQYGDVHLRFRDEAERARMLEPPTEAAQIEQRRRRRMPLITWRPPADVPAQVEPTDDADDEPAEEAVVETDEQRFLRELDDSCDLETVLTRGADLEASFAAFVAAQREAAEKTAADAAGAATDRAAPPDDGGPRRDVPA